ncbi:MAG: hypothetical protein ABW278_04875 [Steroidobacteraceae bacterium]
MRQATRLSARERVTAGSLALLADAVLLWPFLLDDEPTRVAPADAVAFAGIWVQLSTPAAGAAAPAVRLARPVRVRVSGAPGTALAPAPIPAPAGETTAPGLAVDWHQQSLQITSRPVTEPRGSGTFSAPVAVPVPCVARSSSFEWNPQEKRAGLLPLPYVVLGRCVVGLGFFGCSLGKPSEPNSHLFDDLQAGRTPESSVPDVRICD